jgi:hypothetical protein
MRWCARPAGLGLAICLTFPASIAEPTCASEVDPACTDPLMIAGAIESLCRSCTLTSLVVSPAL